MDANIEVYTIGHVAEIVQREFTSKLNLPRNYSATTNMYYNHNNSDSTIYIGIECEIDIEKYASPDSYGFIYEEYDRTLSINREYSPDEYDRLLSKYNRYFTCKIKIKSPLRGKIEEYKGFGLGDKDWLSACHSIDIHIPIPKQGQFSQKQIVGMIDVLKKYLIVASN